MSFSSDIKKWAIKVNKGYDDVATAIMFQTSSEIILGTPVDEGRARGNWFPAIGSPKEGVTDNTTVNLSNIEKVAFESVGDIFYLTNNLPYIKRLEFESHSLQAPNGMVRIAIENVQKNLNEAVNKLT